jgi:hypothetical protein
MVRKSRHRPVKRKALPPPKPESEPKTEAKAESKVEPKVDSKAEAAKSVLQAAKRSLKLPRPVKAAPLGSLTTDFSGATFATVQSVAAEVSRPTQSLIASKTRVQIGPGQHVLGPGGRIGLRVHRF